MPCWCHKCFQLGAIVTASVARCWHSDILALSGYKRQKSALTANPIDTAMSWRCMRITRRSAMAHRCNIIEIKPSLTKEATEKLTHDLATSWLDSNKVFFYGLPATRFDRFQSIQNIVVRIIGKVHKGVASQTLLRSVHWLPIWERIPYKVLLLTFKVLHGTACSYLAHSLV